MYLLGIYQQPYPTVPGLSFPTPFTPHFCPGDYVKEYFELK